MIAIVIVVVPEPAFDLRVAGEPGKRPFRRVGVEEPRDGDVFQARQVIDFSADYDVIDPVAGEKVGALRRKGLKSMFKDEWIILDVHDREIGLIKEGSAMLETVRRFIEFASLLLPQAYHGEVNGQQVCSFKKNFNPLVLKVALDFSSDPTRLLDRRLGIAAAVLLCAIEGRQN